MLHCLVREIHFPFQSFANTPIEPQKIAETPLCDRCHQLKHHHSGTSISNPSIQSLEDTLFESPHKYNHVYHIIDAADFPMSLIPGIHKLLNITPQRSLNRRSKTGRFYHGKKTEVSFIITRADLLSWNQDHINKMMPYLRDVLREAMGRAGKEMRLGNIRCVSSKRSWWTKELKEEIWSRGGGGWIVGKTNVGKSQLIHHVLPKGRMSQGQKGLAPLKVVEKASVIDQPDKPAIEIPDEAKLEKPPYEHDPFDFTNPLNTNTLLPPLPAESQYPELPLVSSFPGTTASPIRLPFGSGKGELIDLPGLTRSTLETYVHPEHRPSLIMTTRVKSLKYTIKPLQVALLGGFIRIACNNPSVTLLVHNFTPLNLHVTSAEKADEIQNQTGVVNVESIAEPGTGSNIKSAGKYKMKYDVTKELSGPLTSHTGAKVRVEKLMFKVFALDVLIEGVGWLEITAQVRTRARFDTQTADAKEGVEIFRPVQPLESEASEVPRKDDREVKEEDEYIDPLSPEIEIFSPEGKFIGTRRPMKTSVLVEKKGATKSRPRKSMKGAKKLAKKRALASYS
jgi:ribosome biogenesis GTPase A